VADKKVIKDAPATGGKSQALQLAVDQIEKQFGKGSIMRLGEAHSANVETIPSGSIGLDLALGGGIPKGRIIEIYGPESSGKTTVCLHAVAEVQKAGGTAAYVDAEHALVRSNAVDIIVVDSVAALVPQAEIEGDMGDAHMGLQARLMSQALRKLTGVINRSKTTVIFVNQLRMKIGVMFGNPETTTGGNALKFYASVRMDIRRISQIKQGDSIIGNHVRVKVVKNKVAPPFREAEFDIMYNQGISKEGDLIDLAANNDIVQKSGAWYEYKGEKISQGREAAKKYLAENPKVFDEIAKATIEAAQQNQ
jgi:recombination protein RecA